MKKFQIVESGGLCVPIFFRMSNKDVKKAIETEAYLQYFDLNKSAQDYLRTLDNDDLFVDPCDEKMNLYFNYK